MASMKRSWRALEAADWVHVCEAKSRMCCSWRLAASIAKRTAGLGGARIERAVAESDKLSNCQMSSSYEISPSLTRPGKSSERRERAGEAARMRACV